MKKLLLLAIAGALPLSAQAPPRGIRPEPIRIQKRLALVIGNAACPKSPLTNPVNDAVAMTRTLPRVGAALATIGLPCDAGQFRPAWFLISVSARYRLAPSGYLRVSVSPSSSPNRSRM